MSDRDLGAGVDPGPGGAVPVAFPQVDVEVPVRGRSAGGGGVKHRDEQIDPDGGGVDGAGVAAHDRQGFADGGFTRVDPGPGRAVPVPLPELAVGSFREQVDPYVAAVGAPPTASGLPELPRINATGSSLAALPVSTQVQAAPSQYRSHRLPSAPRTNRLIRRSSAATSSASPRT